jgi:hypothetical protein
MEHTSDRYTLELEGFLNRKELVGLTLEQARLEWRKAKLDTYPAYRDGEMKPTRWSTWYLYRTGKLVSEGQF